MCGASGVERDGWQVNNARQPDQSGVSPKGNFVASCSMCRNAVRQASFYIVPRGEPVPRSELAATYSVCKLLPGSVTL
jgi:hypothetical protein